MKIPLSKPDITIKEGIEVLKTLFSNKLSCGPRVEEFENKIKELINCKYALVTNSGTSALHLAIKALNVKKGDEIITTPFTFVATINCFLQEGAIPKFVDIDTYTLNINPYKIEKEINNKTKLILPIDVFGTPYNSYILNTIANKYNIPILEDSAEALGSKYNGQHAGTLGDIGVFGFYPNKQITTGEGGALVTNNLEIYKQCKIMRRHGLNDSNNYIINGFNYKLSDINCAIGIAQLNRLSIIIKKRIKMYEIYRQYLKSIKYIELPTYNYDFINPFVFYILLNHKYSKKQRDIVINHLKNKGIECKAYFNPLHLEPFIKNKFGFKKGDFPHTEYIANRIIILPFFSTITKKQIKYIAKNIEKELKYL